METWGKIGPKISRLSLLTSSEVELMETLWGWLGWDWEFLLTSSEVELMETIDAIQT